MEGSNMTLKEESDVPLWKELWNLFQLAIPTIIIVLSFVVPPCLTASYVGRHFGHVYLDAYALANLTGNLLTLAIVQGLYNACDTFGPQAFAAKNYREVGLVALRGFTAPLLVMVPMNVILFVYMQDMLVALGQDAQVSQWAHDFYMVYALSFPFYSLYTIAWKFLSAQHILTPLVVCTLLSTLMVLPLCLEFFVQWFGFLGAAWAITVFYMVESLSVVAWVCLARPHHPDTWPGVTAWPEAMEWEPFGAFCHLGMGGVLTALEWVYWEAVALLIGTLGVVPLSAHTVPSQIIFITYMLPLGMGIALAIQLGAVLATRQVRRAKRLAVGTLLVSVVVFSVLSYGLYVYRFAIFALFTHEEAVIQLCDKVWFDVCLYCCILGVFGINAGISTGLGLQWTGGIVTVIVLWVFGMPASYYFAIQQGGGLEAAWKTIWPPYLLINVIMSLAFVVRSWDEISHEIRQREGLLELDAAARAVDQEELQSLVESTQTTNHNKGVYGSTTNRTQTTRTPSSREHV